MAISSLAPTSADMDIVGLLHLRCFRIVLGRARRALFPVIVAILGDFLVLIVVIVALLCVVGAAFGLLVSHLLLISLIIKRSYDG